MSIKVEPEFRTFVNEGILDNIAIGSGAKGAIKELLKIIDEHKCPVCTCKKKKSK